MEIKRKRVVYSVFNRAYSIGFLDLGGEALLGFHVGKEKAP